MRPITVRASSRTRCPPEPAVPERKLSHPARIRRGGDAWHSRRSRLPGGRVASLDRHARDRWVSLTSRRRSGARFRGPSRQGRPCRAECRIGSCGRAPSHPLHVVPSRVEAETSDGSASAGGRRFASRRLTRPLRHMAGLRRRPDVPAHARRPSYHEPKFPPTNF